MAALAGEQNIFKRRGEVNPPMGFGHQQKPKRVHFVMDISGRFLSFSLFFLSLAFVMGVDLSCWLTS